MAAFEKVVVVVKSTPLDELVRRFNTREQARFYVEHMGGSFDVYQAAHSAYHQSLAFFREHFPAGARSQWIDREFLPTFTFGPRDLVVTIGPDGLVVNTAKYLTNQPVFAVNPDPQRIDGVLTPFKVGHVLSSLPAALDGEYTVRPVTMARATLNDGQSILAVNDLFIGQKTHVSARYRIRHGARGEDQSSSGVIVSTGAGSTGWLRSVVTGSFAIAAALKAGGGKDPADSARFAWDANDLVFSVREPFVSKVSSARIVFGRVSAHEPLKIVSQMPQNGVIFSDGVEEDRIDFNSGAVASIAVAERTLQLMAPAPAGAPAAHSAVKWNPPSWNADGGDTSRDWHGS
jgi:hypothetical protein